MHLKTIELHGFKSFIDKTKLEFGPGVSVIVGPNGSGKSNVADAIRWVLGEQSAKVLRGTKMEDVIFAGTKKRKPLGMAEVSITLDNADGYLPLDYNEVTVTRRTYRSGEGEYLINNSPCRLKDVHNLFVDTGMGSDGFSIIGQGKIDEILNSKPEERRSIIEETAGIVKYRNRKKEAARKLQETEQSLERVQDIISELASQLEPLKLQAEQARIYRLLKAEGDELEINLAVHTMEEVKVKLDEVREFVDHKKLEMVQMEAAQAKYESTVEELRFSINGWDQEINEMQQVIFELFGQAEQKETKIKLASARKETIGSQISKLNEELEDLGRKISEIDLSLAEEQQNQRKLRASIQTQKDLLAAREDSQKEKIENMRALESKIEFLKNNAFDLVQSIADLRNKISSCEQQANALDNVYVKLNTQEQEFIQYLKTNEQKKEKIDSNNREILEEIHAVQQNIESLNRQITDLERSEKEKAEREGKERENLQSLKGKLDLLSEMQNDYEGYYPGVKAVLLASRRNHTGVKEVVGVIAELVKVPDQYRLALETALGGSLQDVVTDTEMGAKAAIEYLKKTKGGRATFLPLNVINRPDNKDLARKVQNMTGFNGFASDLVSYDEKVGPAVDYLLKRVVVVKDMDTALQAARLLRYQAKIVTLDGDVIYPGGSLTGGSRQKKSGNLLSRMGEIEDLKRQVGELESCREETEKSLISCRLALEELKNRREANFARLRELEAALSQGRRDLMQINDALETSEKNLSAVQMEKDGNRREKEAVHSEKSKLIEKLDQRERDNANLLKDISSFQDQLKALKENLDQRNEGLTEIKIKLAALGQEETALKRTLERLQREKDTLLFTLEKKSSEKGELENELIVHDREITDTKQALFGLYQEKEEKEQALNQKKHVRTAESERLAELEKEAKDTNKKLAVIQQEHHQGELKKNRWEMEWEKYLERLEEKFHINFDQARHQKKELVSKKAAASRISEIEKEIESLGTVNLNSIDEYERVNERYQFLTLQQKDLLEAKDALYKVIGEMDRIMTQRFQETFGEVSREFNTTFNKLFGGGMAELRLTNPGEILETGIDIIVQPPGKKLQHLNLLSGGEKALTGIALLFAILTVRPSPFCVLDEIEAALDEANVDRFAAYMYQFSSKTQFIVVSHRQGTMEIADVLYGITMEENGVSKSLSVKLADVTGISA